MPFDSKQFNPQAFGRYVSTIPATKRNELIKSKALRGNKEIRDAFSSQTGTAYAILPMFGRLTGAAQNYDGATSFANTNKLDTYMRGVVVVGRMQSFVENDFSYDITGGTEFMDEVGVQLAEYWDGVDQGTLLAVLSGIFNMTGAENLKFVNGHTSNISAESTVAKQYVNADTLNNAMQKASGDKKALYTIAIMPSQIATNLENLKLLTYLTYTDPEGIERPLGVAAWNGRIVLIDDEMPTVDGYYDAVSSDAGALKVVADSETPGANEIKLGSVKNYFGQKTLAANDYVVAGTQYCTYVLGDGAFDYEDIGAKVPYAMDRNESTNGGQDILFSRQRKVFAPYGLSYKKTSQASNSPTDDELALGTNWELAHNNASTKKYFPHKTIPIARILSRG